MIATVEVFGVEFEVVFEAYAGYRSSEFDPGIEPYLEFESVTIDGLDVWKCLSEQCLDKIEEKLWQEIER